MCRLPLGLLLALVPVTALAQEDLTPPVMVDFTISPVAFDAGQGDVSLNWCVTAQDNLSGLDRVFVFNAGRVDEPGVGLAGQYGGTSPSFGGDLQGTACGTVVIPQFAPLGRYIITMQVRGMSRSVLIFSERRLRVES